MYYWAICKGNECLRPITFDWVSHRELIIKYPKNARKRLEELISGSGYTIKLIGEIGDRAFVEDVIVPDNIMIDDSEEAIIVRCVFE